MSFILPEFLYHYTTIESLALILKSRTIRFNNLLNLDDLEEGKTRDFSDIGRSIFVSCWTDSADEDISLWHMYSKGMSGVRIKMPIRQFEYPPTALLKEPNQDIASKRVDFKGLTICEFTHSEWDPWVKYTDVESEINPIMLPFQENEKSVYLRNVGKVKRTCWSFQKECRYKIMFISSPGDRSDGSSLYEGFVRALSDTRQVNFREVYLKIAENGFNQMEVMLGPGVSAGQKIIVESLMKEYNPVAKDNIIESQLTGKIRI